MDLHRHAQASLDPNTIQELEALRSKLWSLQETFASQIAYLKEPKYPFTWPDLLNKFNMLTAKFASLSEDFYGYIEAGSNGTLPKLMLHPMYPQPPNMKPHSQRSFATKLIPDIEKLELETQAALARELADDDVDDGNDEQLIRTRYEQWTARRQRHDRIANESAQYVYSLVNEHRDTFLQRYDEEEAEEEKEWQKMGFPSEDVWRRWKLECAVNYYSSGKEHLPGSDLRKLGKT